MGIQTWWEEYILVQKIANDCGFFGLDMKTRFQIQILFFSKCYFWLPELGV